MGGVRRRRRHRRGLSTTELALVLPLGLLMVCGLLEYGWMFIKSQQIGNAVRQAARVGAPPDHGVTNVTETIVQVMATAGIPQEYYTLTITGFDDDIETGQMFSVTVSVNYAGIGLGLPLIPTPSQLSSTVTMVKEGP